MRDGKVKWGAVDVDVYPFLETDDELEAFMRKWADPCLVSRSKSGGIHIIAFIRDWVDADVMRKYLAAKRDAVLEPKILAHADEIFPKQKAGNGSQMNLPQCVKWSCFLRQLSGLAKCSIPDDHIDPRRSAFFMARSVLGDIREGNQC